MVALTILKNLENILKQRLDKSPTTILYAVLNWGLGHASRSIPVIKALLSMGHQVIIVSDGIALDLLKNEMPQASFIIAPSYNIDYKSDNMAWAMFKQLHKIYGAIRKEQNHVKQLVKTHKIELIISDHRYGYTSNATKSIFLAHQLSIKANNAFLAYLATLANRYWINKFDEIWIPDTPERNLSGELSIYKGEKPVYFLGPLTRLKDKKLSDKDIDILVILSGVEPKRTDLEKKLTRLLLQLPLKKVLVRGTLSKRGNSKSEEPYHEIHDLADAQKIEQFINRSKVVICRSGYSSIMDLYSMAVAAIVIPTPGQTEQEYLAQHIKNDRFISIKEKDLHDRLYPAIATLVKSY